jgi:Bacterial Alpha-2-macroglobulin MG10 domain
MLQFIHMRGRISTFFTLLKNFLIKFFRLTGEASIAALLRFVPAEIQTTPAFRGLQVHLVIREVDVVTRQPLGLPLSAAGLGSTVHIIVQVTSLDTVGKSTIRVLMAGGLEPIDGNLDDTGLVNICRLPWYLEAYPVSFSSPSSIPWFPPCARIETTPANVTFHVESLSPGTHDFSFLAIAASPGMQLYPYMSHL